MHISNEIYAIFKEPVCWQLKAGIAIDYKCSKFFLLEKNQAFQSQNMIWVEKRDFLPKIRKKNH